MFLLVYWWISPPPLEPHRLPPAITPDLPPHAFDVCVSLAPPGCVFDSLPDHLAAPQIDDPRPDTHLCPSRFLTPPLH